MNFNKYIINEQKRTHKKRILFCLFSVHEMEVL